MKMAMMKSQSGSGKQSGFSMLELVVVMAIILVVSAMAMPSIMNTIADYKLRGTASGIAGTLQSARMLAVKSNQFVTAQQYPSSATSGATIQYFLDGNGNGTPDAGEAIFQLPRNVSFATASVPSNSTMNLGTNWAQPTTAAPFPVSFSPRGLPCMTTTGGTSGTSNVCNTTDSSGKPIGYVYYLTDVRTFGGGFAAVSVSAAGRIKVWMWVGNAWQ